MQLSDEVFLSTYEQQGTKLVRALTQPSEDLILERNSELRKNPDAIRDLTFGRLVANIPLIALDALQRKYPVLLQGDSEQRQLKLMQILNSSEGKKFLVRDHV